MLFTSKKEEYETQESFIIVGCPGDIDYFRSSGFCCDWTPFPIDPIITLPPIILFDPCLGASLIATVISTGSFDLSYPSSGDAYYTYVATYDLSVLGIVVAHGISTYRRVTVGSIDNVTMKDTFIDPGDSVTVFGHSVNRG